MSEEVEAAAGGDRFGGGDPGARIAICLIALAAVVYLLTPAGSILACVIGAAGVVALRFGWCRRGDVAGLGLLSLAVIGIWGSGAMRALAAARQAALDALGRGRVDLYATSPSAWAAAVLWGILVGSVAALALAHALERRDAHLDRRRQPRFPITAQLQLRLWPREPRDGTLLGIDTRGRRVVVPHARLSCHALVVGASGSGKTTTLLLIVDAALRAGLPVVAIDLKGGSAKEGSSLAAEIAKAAAHNGRTFKLWALDGPGYWNPLARGKATELADKLIELEAWTEPHYKAVAYEYLQTLFDILIAAGERPTLSRVVDLLNPLRLNLLLRQVPADLRRVVASELTDLPRDQESAIAGLRKRVKAFVRPSTERWFQAADDERTIDLTDEIQGDGAVVFALNSSTYPEFAPRVGRIVVQDLKTVVGELTELGGHERALFVIDEFSALGSDLVVALVQRARSAGLGVLLSTQELADLDRVDPGFRDQVTGNTETKLIHRCDVSDSAQFVADLAGTRESSTRTRQTSARGVLGRLGLGASSTGLGTEHTTERYKAHPNVIKELGTGELVLIQKNPARVRLVKVIPLSQRRRRRNDPRGSAPALRKIWARATSAR